jgi:hypothetical protein
MGMVTIVALWLSMTMGIISFEHVTKYKGSKIWYELIDSMTTMILFSRKPKFRRKLNLKTTVYRASRSSRSVRNKDSMYNIILPNNWIRAMTTYIGTKREIIPNASQMDNYAIAMSNVIRFDSDSSPIKIDNCCTQTLSGFKEDFIQSTLKHVEHLHVNGFGNTKTAISHK